MTPGLQVAATVTVGTIALINLVILYGVVRRLRDHEARLVAHPPQPVGSDASLVAVGSKVDDFGTADQRGNPVSLSTLSGPTLVGFFSASCEPCQTLVPQFVAAAASWPGGVSRVLAVLTQRGPSHEEYLVKLSPVATIVDPEHAQPVAAAFGLRAVPAVCVVDADGIVSAEGRSLVSSDARAPV